MHAFCFGGRLYDAHRVGAARWTLFVELPCALVVLGLSACGSTYPLESLGGQPVLVEPTAGTAAPVPIPAGRVGASGTTGQAGRDPLPRAGIGAVGPAGSIAPPPVRDLDRDGFFPPNDCDDFDPTIYPRSRYEQCCDSIDSDCDGRDAPSEVACTCRPPVEDLDGDGYPSNTMGPKWDCDDKDPSVHPGVPEICNDRRDNDCNFAIDWDDKACNDGRSNAPDRDGDGYTTLIDCNDSDRNVHPGAPEICGDRIDNDCDGVVDPCPTEVDNDRDGYAQGVDCNDWDAHIYPGSIEYCCDSVDTNCDGTDNPVGVSCDCADADGDGYVAGPTQPSFMDCDDHNPNVHPGVPELCADGLDNNCDGFRDGNDRTCILLR